ncbi:MAG: DUF349 domain-containing protein [Pontibacterium sp.]
MLFRFFKPKWQNQKPEVRLRAVEEISNATPDSHKIIEQLAITDPDQAVRCAAIARLTSLQPLLTISGQRADEITLRTARDRICSLIVNSDNSIDERHAALSALTQPHLLTHVVLNANEQPLQIVALEKLDDQDALATIIRNSTLAQLRRLAADKLTDLSLVTTLSKETLSRDKGVNRILRSKLAEINKARQAQQDLQARCEALGKTIEQHANCDYFPQYGGKLQALELEWRKVETSASAALQNLITAALETARARHQQQLDNAEAEQTAARKAAAVQAQKQQQLSELDHLKTSLLQAALQDSSTCTDASKQQLAHLKSTWAPLQTAKNDRLNQDFEQKQDQCHQLLNALDKLNALTEDAGHLISQTESLNDLPGPQLERLRHKCRQLIKKVNWPDKQAPALLKMLKQRVEELDSQLQLNRSRNASRLGQFEKLLNELDLAIREGQSKAADRYLKQAEQFSDGLGKIRSKSLDQRLKQLSAQIQELKEWQGYAVAPKKEALCAAMEALSESTLEPQQLAQKIRELQQQWKQLDSTDSVHSHAIWKRFKRAADVAYTPCEAHFNSQKALRKTNLNNRHKLCEQLSHYLESMNQGDTNWKELDGLLKQVKREWREYSPVDRSPGKKAQIQFNELIQALEAPLKAYRRENAELKSALIDEVKAILALDDLSTAIDSVKALQNRWKLTGPTVRNKEQVLWQEFSQRCNEVFDLYHDKRRAQSELNYSVALQVEAICDNAEQAREALCGLTHARELLQSCQNLPDGFEFQLSETLHQRFQAAYTFAKAQSAELERMQDSQFEALQRKAVLCEQLETALLEADSQPVLQAIEAAWQASGTVSGTEARAMEDRFLLLQQLNSQAPDMLHTHIENQNLRLRQLCIRLEIALGQPSPVQDQALRMEYQMQRLQQALAQQEEALNLKAVRALRCEWLAIPFSSYYPELCQRFNGLTDQLR